MRMLTAAGSIRWILLASSIGCGGAAFSPELPPPPSSDAARALPPPSTAPPPASIAPPPEDTTLGRLDFPVTGSPECQIKFKKGVLELHSFQYEQARGTFEAAFKADAACAMAAWGVAMTHDHPVWHERDVVKARASLARVTKEDSLTPKERAFLAAARALFASDDTKEAHKAWLAAAAAMHAEYADDDEIALQHALALIGVYAYDHAHVREQMEAATITLDVLARKPQHPGAAHYTIHACDSPEHAILALQAARTYARIAPASEHAVHMPSHTFAHLGMWREVVSSNERAYAASIADAKAQKHGPMEYDWHSYSWLVAAHLELGQHAAARKLVDEAKALYDAATDDTADFRYDYVDMVTDYVTQSGRWADVEMLAAPLLAPVKDEGKGGDGPVACAAHAPGGTGSFRMPVALIARMQAERLRAEAAIRLKDGATADKRITAMKTSYAQMGLWSKAFPPEFTKRRDGLAEMLSAQARYAAKPSPATQKAALAALEKQVEAERATSIAGPAWTTTSRELFGEALAQAGKSKEALAQFELEARTRPNRAPSLLGAARAAKASGDAAKARQYYATLADLWRDADADLPALAEVRAGSK